MGPGICPLCGRKADELHRSRATGGVSCERCYCAAAPPTSRETHRPTRPRSPKPDRYARFVQHLQTRLSQLDVLPFTYGDGRHIAAYCPVCRDGTVLITLAELRDRPAARYSTGETDGCSLGCPSDLIVSVIG